MTLGARNDMQFPSAGVCFTDVSDRVHVASASNRSGPIGPVVRYLVISLAVILGLIVAGTVVAFAWWGR